MIKNVVILSGLITLLISCDRAVTETYKVTNKTSDSIYVKWTNSFSGPDSIWIRMDSEKVLAIVDGHGTGGRATATAIYNNSENIDINDMWIKSIQKDSLESNIDYLSLDSWEFYTTDKKETNGVYELIVADSDFEIE